MLIADNGAGDVAEKQAPGLFPVRYTKGMATCFCFPLFLLL